MHVSDAIRRRRMVRSFDPDPLDTADLEEILDLARRAPSAGNTQATEFLLLTGRAETERYWSTTFRPEKRSSFRFPGLFDAPVLVIVTTRPDAYTERYGEPDKARELLGVSAENWPQPFWWIDAGMVAEHLLLLATERGLGACLFGLFDHEEAVKRTFTVPDDRRLVCTIALGRPADDSDATGSGRSASRPRRLRGDVIHVGRWNTGAIVDQAGEISG